MQWFLEIEVVPYSRYTGQMKREMYLATKIAEAEKVDLDPKKRLKEIISTPLATENLDTYFEEALKDLMSVANQAVSQFQAMHGRLRLSQTHLEDRAFSFFGIEQLSDVLALLGRKQSEIVAVDAYLQKHSISAPHVIVPPGEGRIVSGSGGFKKIGMKKRVRTLLYILKDEGVSLDDLSLQNGPVSKEMVRHTSYFAIDVPSFNRLLLVCDEENNASYIFDRKKLAAVASVEEILKMQKDKLDKLLGKHKHLGVRFIYSGTWAERVRELLKENLVHNGTDSIVSAAGEFARVSYAELDPWRRFYTAPDGKHYSTVFALAERFNVSDKLVLKWIKENKLIPITGKDRNKHNIKLYEYEAILAQHGQFLSLPRAVHSGDWKGFVEKEEKHFAPLSVISVRIRIHEITLRKRTKDLPLTSLQMRDMSGREVVGYAYEDIAPSFSRYLSLPKVETTGPWKGFFKKDGIPFGSLRAIADRLSSNKTFIYRIVNAGGFSYVKVQSRGGQEIDAYSFPEIQNALEDNKPLVKDLNRSKK
jgi:hypothetical protein